MLRPDIVPPRHSRERQPPSIYRVLEPGCPSSQKPDAQLPNQIQARIQRTLDRSIPVGHCRTYYSNAIKTEAKVELTSLISLRRLLSPITPPG